jgi:hypothetical protein
VRPQKLPAVGLFEVSALMLVRARLLGERADVRRTAAAIDPAIIGSLADGFAAAPAMAFLLIYKDRRFSANGECGARPNDASAR